MIALLVVFGVGVALGMYIASQIEISIKKRIK